MDMGLLLQKGACLYAGVGDGWSTEKTKGIWADNSPHVVKGKYLQTDEPQQTLSRMNLNKITLKCTAVRWQKLESRGLLKQRKKTLQPHEFASGVNTAEHVIYMIYEGLASSNRKPWRPQGVA